MHIILTVGRTSVDANDFSLFRYAPSPLRNFRSHRSGSSQQLVCRDECKRARERTRKAVEPLLTD
jgi:hypothetical protein